MSDIDDNRVVYALTWHSPEGHPYYWSLRKGWTPNGDAAWLLSKYEVDNIEEDERLQNKLPQHKERKDGANWEPYAQRFDDFTPLGGVDDDELTYLATSTGD
jgi:hypothetical protein